MKLYRSILACVLALVTTFVVGCSSPKTAIPTTYTPTQIQQIQKHNTDIVALRDRLTTELPRYISAQNWVQVDSFIHGPLGSLLQEMNYITKNLLPDVQPKASKLSRQVFEDLVEVSKAVKNRDTVQAASGYQQALKDLDSFLSLVPNA
ncbi:MAG TPA: photosystem II protein PsbQ [Planktothrix sp. UBA8407]|jgi:photosystem II protein PsbQ|nr:photosystem II protein PsbQ [Planktothrix sp. UBA8402]HAO10098.1 photosystem II protein PsbQ [Planktothrix sp. UBA8407]HBK22447.1 photosystem II protein PsbQ [Planktothrix sp. UBA10369]